MQRPSFPSSGVQFRYVGVMATRLFLVLWLQTSCRTSSLPGNRNAYANGVCGTALSNSWFSSIQIKIRGVGVGEAAKTLGLINRGSKVISDFRGPQRPSEQDYNTLPISSYSRLCAKRTHNLFHQSLPPGLSTSFSFSQDILWQLPHASLSPKDRVEKRIFGCEDISLDLTYR